MRRGGAGLRSIQDRGDVGACRLVVETDAHQRHEEHHPQQVLHVPLEEGAVADRHEGAGSPKLPRSQRAVAFWVARIATVPASLAGYPVCRKGHVLRDIPIVRKRDAGSAKGFRPTTPRRAPTTGALLHQFLVPSRDDAVLLVRPVTSLGLAGSLTVAHVGLADIETGEIVTGSQAVTECVLALLQAVRRRPTGAVVGPPLGPPDAVAGATLEVPLAGLVVGLARVGTHLALAEGKRPDSNTGQPAQRLPPRPDPADSAYSPSNRSESTRVPSIHDAPEGTRPGLRNHSAQAGSAGSAIAAQAIRTNVRRMDKLSEAVAP